MSLRKRGRGQAKYIVQRPAGGIIAAQAVHAPARRGGLAVPNGLAAIGQGFPPGEVVVVFNLGQRLFAQGLAKTVMAELSIRQPAFGS